MKKVEVYNVNEMRELGIRIGEKLKGGETICLTGDLGVGKTHLTKFIGEGMGIHDYITSPTFAILNIYEGEINLNHFDTYRLENVVDFDELGFDDYLFSDDVNIIEWPEMIREILPKDTLDIKMERDEVGSRTLTFTTTAEEKYKEIFEVI